MLKVALTTREQQFAAENHRLIFAFLNEQELAEVDYYDIAALGYLEAVHRYLSEPSLRSFAFSTIAYRAMLKSLSHSLFIQLRQQRIEAVSLDTGGPDGMPYPQQAIARRRFEEQLFLHALAGLPAHQYELVRMRLDGCTVREIARRKKTTEKKVRSLLRQTRQTLSDTYILP